MHTENKQKPLNYPYNQALKQVTQIHWTHIPKRRRRRRSTPTTTLFQEAFTAQKKAFFPFLFFFSSYLSQYASGGISRALLRLNVGYPIDDENTRRKIPFNQSHYHLSY
jgi:hypothetical protein